MSEHLISKLEARKKYIDDQNRIRLEKSEAIRRADTELVNRAFQVAMTTSPYKDLGLEDYKSNLIKAFEPKPNTKFYLKPWSKTYCRVAVTISDNGAEKYAPLDVEETDLLDIILDLLKHV